MTSISHLVQLHIVLFCTII